MSVAWLIARHELRRTFVQPWAWLLLAATLALVAYDFVLYVGAFFEASGKAVGLDSSVGVTDRIAIPVLYALANLLIMLVPLVTMRSIAGDRRQHALTLLLASGVGNGSIVVGKWLSAWLYVALLIGLVSLMPLALGFGASLDYGRIASAVIGLLAQTAMLCAIGVWASSWTDQPAFAAALTLGLTLLLSMVDVGARLQGVHNAGINYLAIPTHLGPLFHGIVSSIDLAYFAIVTTVALVLSARRVDTLRETG